MGAAMARNLCRAGHDVRVWNRTLAKAEPLAADGATVAATPAEAVADADVVLTMLYDGPAALEAMTAAGPGLRPGAIWLQSTTAGVEAIAPLADLARLQGLVFVDAPSSEPRHPPRTANSSSWRRAPKRPAPRWPPSSTPWAGVRSGCPTTAPPARPAA